MEKKGHTKNIMLWLTKNISRWAWKKQKQRKNRDCRARWCKMYVSETQIKRYQYRCHPREFTTFLFSFDFRRRFNWVHCKFRETKKLLLHCALRCQSESMKRCRKKHQHNRIMWNLIFNIFSANFFSLMFKMKVNICLDSDRMQFLELCEYWFFFFCALHVGRNKKNLSPWLEKSDVNLNNASNKFGQFRVRRWFVHGICYGSKRKKTSNVKCHWSC